MTEIIKHRGPDDEGYAFFSLDSALRPKLYGGKDTPQEIYHTPLSYAPKHSIEHFHLDNELLTFGHRRLSIVDLSILGHQPFGDPSGRYWIIYNGEVYNYLEIRNILEKLGHTFVSHTDTEVILHAYMEWGKECLHHFNGMFAFLIFDRHNKTLFGARDRFAIKPLYYWLSPEGFIAFGSEIKQFTVLPGWQAKIAPQGIYDFLNWGMTNHLEETCFKEVFQLQGGHCFSLKIEPDFPPVLTPQQWYKLPVGKYAGSLEDAGKHFNDLLKDSVRLRSRADVSIGSCLSGGLDSSSIVCLAHEILQEQGSLHPQMTFSACSHYKKFDEREFIEAVLEGRNIKSFYTYPSLDELWQQLDDITWHQDEPYGSTSIFAQWEVFKHVGQNKVKVMLDGQGADEQLAGYGGFLAARLGDLARNFQFISLWKELQSCRNLHQISFPTKHLLNQFLPNAIKAPLKKILNKPTSHPSWLNNGVLKANFRDPNEYPIPIKEAVQKLCYAQITKTNLPMLLHFEDRNSMAHSIEARTPFLDYRLVEFIMGLPADYKLAEGITKRVQRQGLTGTLPDKIRQRISKLGFATPEEVWVKQHQPKFFQELIRASVKNSHGILNQKAIHLADQMISGQIPFNFLLWRMIVLGKWIHRFSMTI